MELFYNDKPYNVEKEFIWKYNSLNESGIENYINSMKEKVGKALKDKESALFKLLSKLSKSKKSDSPTDNQEQIKQQIESLNNFQSTLQNMFTQLTQMFPIKA